MALSIYQILSVSKEAAMRASGKPYWISDIYQPEGMAGYVTFINDRETLTRIPIAWSFSDEEKLASATENDRINFVYSLLRNAINAMDVLLAEQKHKDDVRDVTYE